VQDGQDITAKKGQRRQLETRVLQQSSWDRTTGIEELKKKIW
jgi:hypothetical protein